MADGIVQVGRCQACGQTGDVRHLTFRQNTGMLIARRTTTYSGQMCRRCAGTTFQKTLLHNLTLGWWGVISIMATPIFILMNIVEYSKSRSMQEIGLSTVSAGPPADGGALPQ